MAPTHPRKEGGNNAGDTMRLWLQPEGRVTLGYEVPLWYWNLRGTVHQTPHCQAEPTGRAMRCTVQDAHCMQLERRTRLQPGHWTIQITSCVAYCARSASRTVHCDDSRTVARRIAESARKVLLLRVQG